MHRVTEVREESVHDSLETLLDELSHPFTEPNHADHYTFATPVPDRKVLINGLTLIALGISIFVLILGETFSSGCS